jgi:hypothetical protein
MFGEYVLQAKRIDKSELIYNLSKKNSLWAMICAVKPSLFQNQGKQKFKNYFTGFL